MTTITYMQDFIEIQTEAGPTRCYAWISNIGLAYQMHSAEWNGTAVKRTYHVTHVASGRAIPGAHFSTPEQCKQFIEYCTKPIAGITVDWHRSMEDIQAQLFQRIDRERLRAWFGINATEIREVAKELAG